MLGNSWEEPTHSIRSSFQTKAASAINPALSGEPFALQVASDRMLRRTFIGGEIPLGQHDPAARCLAPALACAVGRSGKYSLLPGGGYGRGGIDGRLPRRAQAVAA